MSSLHPKIARILSVMEPGKPQVPDKRQTDTPWKIMAPFAHYHLAKGQVSSVTGFSQKFATRHSVQAAPTLMSEPADTDNFQFQKSFCAKQNWGPIYRA